MKIKQIISIVTLVLAVGSCSNDDFLQPQSQSECVPIVLAYTTIPTVSTRSVADADLNTDYIVSGKQVTVRISNAELGEWTDYNYTTGESGVLNLPEVPNNVPFYPLDGTTKIDILAYYPAFAGTAFTIKSDQSANDGYAASDLMWAEPLNNVAKTTANQTLQFSHKMAKIVVNASVGKGVTQINSVTLKQVKPTVTFDKGVGTVSNVRGTASEVTMAIGESGTSVSCAAVIPGQTIEGDLLEIGVTKSDGTTGTAVFSVDSKTFTANKVYTLDITVNSNNLIIPTLISGWAEGASSVVKSYGHILTFNVSGVEFKMVYVEGGDFSMPFQNELNQPIYYVSGSVSDYYIAQTETTNKLWNAVMKIGNPSYTHNSKNNGDLATVTYIGYNVIAGSDGTGTDPNCFLYKLNSILDSQLASYGLQGKRFKMPTEIQWEYAAIGGKYSRGYKYAGSNTVEDVAVRGITNVMTKGANELGLYDMAGNAWEMTCDMYNAITGNMEVGLDYTSNSGSHLVLLSSSVVGEQSAVYYRYGNCNAPKDDAGYNETTIRFVLQ